MTNVHENMKSVRYLMASSVCLKKGCQWRMLPVSFPPWPTGYYYFCGWKHKGIIEQIHEHLRDRVHINAEKKLSDY
jgi:transposase